MEKDWVKLFTTTHTQKAEVICGLLNENGIETVALNKKDSAYMIFGEVEIYCHAQNALVALQIIEQNQPL